MRGITHDSFTRSIPGGGMDSIGCITATDQIFNTSRKREMVSLYGGPTNMQKIAHQVSTTGIAHPYDGSASTTAAQAGSLEGLTTFTMRTDCLAASGGAFGSNVTPAGLILLVFVSSKLLIRVITGVNSGLVVNVNRAWSTAIDGTIPTTGGGDWYTLLYPTAWLNHLYIAGDVPNTASTTNPTIVPVLYDFGVDVYGAAAPTRKPLPTADVAKTLANTGTTVPHMVDASRYACAPVNYDTRGMLGAKAVLTSLNSATNISLFMGAS